MDYRCFGAQHPRQQAPPYGFMGVMDAEARSSAEPLDVDLFPAPFDAFTTFHGLPTPQQGSPEAALPLTPMPVGSVDSGLGGDVDDARASRTRSSSEEKESLTPAQSRRKAQNRAAQRAFRERKERHVRELEAKLSALENSTHSLQSDNERLKLALQRARTENEILRATSGQSPKSSHHRLSVSYPSPGAHLPDHDHDHDHEGDDDDDDDDYNVQPLNNGSVVNAADRDHAASSHKPNGKEVAATQAWDLIQTHPLVKQGVVDITDVCERLKGKTRCDGRGPVFEEATIWQAVEESRRSGGDELI